MAGQAAPLIEVVGLKKYFPIRQGLFLRAAGVVRAVDGVSFSVAQGETFSLVGESGSGKTTVGRTILRAIEPTAGEVRFHQSPREVTEITALDKKHLRLFRRNMQMIFQDPYSSLNPRMTVRDIIAEPYVVNGSGSLKDVDDQVVAVARRCRLNIDYLRRYPHAFSGGERQRIGIARSLILNPKFIVCDEPVSALDVSIQAEILNLLAELQAEMGLTYLFISHDLSVVEHVSDRIAVMYLGQLVETAPTEDLFNHPLHPYTEALLSAIPVADPRQQMKPISLAGEIPSPLNPPAGCHFHPRCPYAEDICRSTPPAWLEPAEGHRATCHFAGSLPLKGVYAH